MTRSWRIGTAVLIAAAALASGACGKAEAPANKPDVAQGGKDFGSAGDQTAKLGTDAKPGEFPRTIRHGMGETKLTKRPERVVVLDVGELDNVVALGVKPVGVAYTEGSPKAPVYLADQAGAPASVGTTNNLKLEAIWALKPDLILGTKLRAEQQYGKLSEIAPTVFALRVGYTWKENFRLNAAALDRLDEADKQIADVERKAKELGAKAEAAGKRPSISMVRFMPGKIRLYGQKSFIGTILADAGLPRPQAEQVDDLAVEVSAEQITKADADWIFVGSYGDPAKTAQQDVLAGPLWNQLAAVKAGHMQRVDDDTWYNGLGVLAANSVLADLTKILGV